MNTYYNISYTTLSGRDVNGGTNYLEYAEAAKAVMNLHNLKTGIVREFTNGYNTRNWYYTAEGNVWVP